MGSAGGQTSGGTQQQSTRNTLPSWASPEAKEYLASMAQLVYGPGTTTPAKNIPQGYTFGSGAAAPSAGNPAASGGGTAGGANQQPPGTQGLNPALANAFIQPMAGNSTYLQGQAAQNPNYLANQASPAAFNQLSLLYPSLMGAGGTS